MGASSNGKYEYPLGLFTISIFFSWRYVKMVVGKQSVSQYNVISARMVSSDGVVRGSDQARNFS
jgi:hypothetical protein